MVLLMTMTTSSAYAFIIVLALGFVGHSQAFSSSSIIHGACSSSPTTAPLQAATSSHQGGSLPLLPDIRAAVIVPGFLTGKDEFLPLANSLCNIGIPSVVVPSPNWHWLPCLGGRSMRPMLERIDFTIRHLAGVAGNLGDFERTTTESLEQSVEDAYLQKQTKNDNPQLLIPNFSYNLLDCYADFRNNPGGVLEVGGSAEVDKYPLWEPKGRFPAAPEQMGRVALIGHSGKCSILSFSFYLFYNDIVFTHIC